MLFLADLAIVVSCFLFIWGTTSDPICGEVEPVFFNNILTAVGVNTMALCLLVVGLHFQDYSPTSESRLEILWQIVTAFARIFGFTGGDAAAL